MQVRNTHERMLPVSPEIAGAMLDSLASEQDRLWPRDRWPAMRFDRPLCVGAVGGHGPIRYFVQTYHPGERVCFRFTKPRGFIGTHGFEIEPIAPDSVRLRHTLTMEATGPALLSWPLIFRPLHDALIEDSFDRASQSLGLEPNRQHWSTWVHVLRWLLGRTRRRDPKQPVQPA